MSILAIDPGISTAGWALYIPATHKIQYGQINTNASDNKYVRTNKIVDGLKQLSDGRQINLVVMEDFNIYKKGRERIGTVIRKAVVLCVVGALQEAFRGRRLEIVLNRTWEPKWNKGIPGAPNVSNLPEHARDAAKMLIAQCSDVIGPLNTIRLERIKCK